MAEMTHLDRVRRKRTFRRNSHYLMIFLVMVLGVVLCVMGIQMAWHSTWLEQVSMQMHSIGSGLGYPLTMEGRSVKQMQPFGPDLAVLTDTSFQVYNPSAKPVQNVQHHLSNPQASFSVVRALLFERGGKKAAVYSCHDLIHEKSYEEAIITGDISDSGVFAVATQGTRDNSLVYVYNKAGDELFTWHSQERVSRITLSEDGRTMAVFTMAAHEGVLNTDVWLFDVTRKTEPKMHTLPDQMAVQAGFLSSSEFFVVTDRESLVITRSGELKYTYSYGGRPLTGCSVGEDHLALVLGDYNDFKETEIVLLDDKCEAVGTVEMKERILDFMLTDNRMVLLTQDSIAEFSLTGQLKKAHAAEDIGLKAVPLKSSVYLCTPTGIEKVKLRTVAPVASAEA